MPINDQIRFSIAPVDHADRDRLYRLRHAVYATELGQYSEQPDGLLPDRDDVSAIYVMAEIGDEVVGFIGITPPSSPRLSLDNHVAREDFPVPVDENVYEIRALTVCPRLRGPQVAWLLMYAAFRWVQSHGGRTILGMGRLEVLDMYLRAGFCDTGTRFCGGSVHYSVIVGDVATLSETIDRFRDRLRKARERIVWNLDFPFEQPSGCYHGGAFFDAIGSQFDDLSRRNDVINADVLDAWFPPAPAIEAVLRDNLGWLMRTSPPTDADGMIRALSAARGVPADRFLVGAGSSTLIFLAFRYWLKPSSRVLILEPTYGEYNHVLENVVNCQITRFTLSRQDGYQVDLAALRRVLQDPFDLFVWVNPNSPTGLHVARKDVEEILQSASRCRRVWIDETYVDYAGEDASLESFAANSENVVVCKSMSKVYALSGMRAAYLCASPHQLEALRQVTPPWAVGLPAQVAATYALQATAYYRSCYQETHVLREQLANGLRELGINEIIPGIANYLLFQLPVSFGAAKDVVMRCRTAGLYLRIVGGLGPTLGPQAIRIAVKDAATNARMLTILAQTIEKSE